MAYDFQVTMDAADPHGQADWWAAAMGWLVEPSNEDFIRSMIAQGFAKDSDTTTHHGVLVWKEGAAILHPDTPPQGARPRILFVLVPESKTVKNRVHLDVNVGHEQVPAVEEKLMAAGASVIYRGQQGPHSWVTMTDPEGNEFCIR